MSNSQQTVIYKLPDTGFIRLAEIARDPKRPEKEPMLPFSRATVWRKVKNDPDFPKPVKLGPRITAWRVEEIREWIKKQGGVR